ncbi:MAG: hypothetical protein NWQ13_11610, partial [Glaciimonas sp.]|nr:hypothetical protein [Glaciimonas sp.]
MSLTAQYFSHMCAMWGAISIAQLLQAPAEFFVKTSKIGIDNPHIDTVTGKATLSTHLFCPNWINGVKFCCFVWRSKWCSKWEGHNLWLLWL